MGCSAKWASDQYDEAQHVSSMIKNHQEVAIMYSKLREYKRNGEMLKENKTEQQDIVERQIESFKEMEEESFRNQSRSLKRHYDFLLQQHTRLVEERNIIFQELAELLDIEDRQLRIINDSFFSIDDTLRALILRLDIDDIDKLI